MNRLGTLLITLLMSFFLFVEAAPEKEKKLLLVVGCGRSGTAYMTSFLKQAGVQVRHEQMGEDGSVSWLLTARTDWAPWGPLSADYDFAHVFHQVRNPIKMIQSFYNSPPLATWNWISYVIPEIELSDPDLTKCVKYWIYWNKMAEAQAEWTYRIEDFDNCYKEFGERLGIALSCEDVKAIAKDTNTRGVPQHPITWEILKDELDSDLYQLLCETAIHYGYDCN